jgi:hypothetical protein
MRLSLLNRRMPCRLLPGARLRAGLVSEDHLTPVRWRDRRSGLLSGTTCVRGMWRTVGDFVGTLGNFRYHPVTVRSGAEGKKTLGG